MAASLTDAERNALADNEASRWAYLSLHTANPGTTGASEASGGSPAYARKALTFNSAGAVGPLGGTLQPATVGVAWSNEVTFDTNQVVTHFGGQSASTAGTYRGGNALAASQGTASTQTQVKVSIGIGPVAGA